MGHGKMSLKGVLGTVGTTETTPIVYTIGFVRETLVQLLNLPNVNSVRGPYNMTRYNSSMSTAYISRGNAYMTLRKLLRSSMTGPMP